MNDVVDTVPNAGRLERLLGHPAFQRVVAGATGLAALALAGWAATAIASGSSHFYLLDADSLAGRAQRFELVTRVALTVVAGALAAYLAWRGGRMPLARLLAVSAGALAAGIGLFIATRVYVARVRDEDVQRFVEMRGGMLVVLVIASVFLMAVFLFGTMKFLIYFPRPVKLATFDPADDRAGRSGRGGRFEWRWLVSPQFAALAAGWIVITMVDLQAQRLSSSFFNDATFYMVCWLPFAFLSAKQRHLGDEARRSIRWVVLGQAVCLVAFLATMLALFALLAAGTLPLGDWTMANAFADAVITAFMEAFVLVFLATLAISIFYHGTIDPDLMIRRTWVLGAVGLISGILFVLAERALATAVAGWAGLSTLDALTVVAVLTAVLMVPLRARVERWIRHVVEGWQTAFAIAGGPRQVACIVFADLSGYTALTERDERAAITLAAVFHRAAASVAGSHGGRLIKTIGDAVLLRLPTSDQAVAAVRALSAAYHERAAKLGLEVLPLHTAIHRGEVVEAGDGDVFGSTVNLAARLLGAAGPNEVVASASMLEALSPAIGREPLGERQFKNVEQPVACFRLAV